MILIISNEYEPTTDLVIDWLISKNACFLRINSEDISQVLQTNKISPTSDLLILNGQEVDLKKINVIWYRRWYDYSNFRVQAPTKHIRQALNEAKEECNNVSSFLFKILSDKTWLTSPFVNKLHNKLYALRMAKSVGLSIPATLITNSKKELLDFYHDNNNSIITKPVGDPYVFVDEKTEDNYKSFTEKVSSAFLKKLNDFFFSSLFQAYLPTKNELRVFYLDGEFYPTAIINSKTTDIKLSVSYGVSKINMVAIQLPEEIAEQLHQLMKILELNSGSIDLLQTEDGNIHFIEVNPIGQFMGYSGSLNYQLDEKIADWLIKKDSYEKAENQI